MRRGRVEEGHYEVDLEGVPQANRTYWFKCEDCDNLHVVLEGVDGKPVASMVLDVDMLENMVDAIHGPPSAVKVRKQ